MTGNELSGHTAAKTMIKALAEKGITSGTIGLAASTAGTPNTDERLKGFRDELEGSSFTLAPTFYMGTESQKMKDEVKAHPEYVAFFASNQRSTIAIGEQVKESATNQIIVGFDTAEETLNLVKDGVIYVTIKQNGEAMGHDGIEFAVLALNGNLEQENFFKDTGVNLITKEIAESMTK